MFVKDIISDKLPPLKTSDSGITALAWMDEHKVNHWPVVNDEDFLALICDTDVYNQKKPEEAIGTFQLSLIRPYVKINQHLFDVLRLFKEQKLTLLPVLDLNNRYLGVITLPTLLSHLADMLAAEDPGALIILELNQNDYLLSQIVQIVESNDSKVINISTYTEPDSTRLILVIKINRMDLGPVLQTFNRFNYNVIAHYTDDNFNDDVMDRYNEFLNYLNI